MDKFLNQCRHSLTNLDLFHTINIVIGNESCDLDSAISTIVYSYHLFISKFSTKTDEIILPVLNINRGKLNLKSELLFWFHESLHLDINLLICKNEINFNQLKESNKNILITLVDHNYNSEMSKFGKIVEIIDHHILKANNEEDKNENIYCNKEIDVTVGSCCTLIAKRYLTWCEKNHIEPDVQIALMLHGVIILDTVCFSSSAQRFNDLDVLIDKKLKIILGSDVLTDKEIYDQLMKIRNDSVDKLTIEELLAKDIKLIDGIDERKVGITSISGLLIRELMRRSGAISEINDYTIKNGLIGLILLGIKTDNSNELQRDLGIFFLNTDLLRKICERLCLSCSQLNLEILFELTGFACYKQGNVQLSRKAILPMINDIISTQRVTLQALKGDFEKKTNMKTSPSVDGSPESLSFKDGNIIGSNKGSYSFNEIINSQGKNNCCEYDFSPFSKEINDARYSSLQLDSMNVYGSYIDDSYVGEFTGEVDPSYIQESCDKDSFWQSEDKLDHVLEFSFDSFGPESLMFPRPPQENEDLLPDVSKEYLNDNGTNIMLSNLVSEDDNTRNELNSECNLSINNVKNSIDKEISHIIINEDNIHNSENDISIKDDDELLSLSVVEPQLKEKVESCFDESKIKGTYELTPEEKNNKDAYNKMSFQRNSSLTQSQRKKIHTQMKVNEIFASFNDRVEATIDTKEKQEKDGNKQGSENEFNLVKDDAEDKLRSHSSIIKKKIIVNRDLLNNDEIHESQPKTKSVSFATEQEPPKIPELTAKEELEEARRWRESCPIGRKGEIKRIDLKVIEPYKKVLTHGGYYHHYNTAQLTRNNSFATPGPTIIIFSACYLPDRSRKDYDYVMDNLFMYVLTTLHELVADDYILVYFHNAGCSGVSCNNMPTFGWLKRCYTMIDRRLRKNLKSLLLVHPTFWLKTFVIMTKPFISSKFARKLRFVSSLAELNNIVPIESTIIPPPVKQVEFDRLIRQKKKSRR